MGKSGSRGVGKSGDRYLRPARFIVAASLLLLVANASAAMAFATSTPPSRARMAAIPAGRYHPLYADGAPAMKVGAFSLDREPVSRAQFLAFARANPAWQKGMEMTGSALDRPVTGITWFAARAYCAAQGKRLPTTAEWEYVASADERRRDATRDPAFSQRLVALYTTRPEARVHGDGERFRNVYGVSALHGVVWEWTADFDGARADHAAHGEHGDHHGATKAMAGMKHGGGEHAHMLFCASAAIGASNPSDYAAFMRYGFRAGLTRSSAHQMLGFRCAI
jgi:formylglycine-generating enzyme